MLAAGLGIPAARMLVLIFAILSIGIITTGYLYYRDSEQRYRREVENQLAAVTDLKISGIVHYREERLENAARLVNNVSLANLVGQFFEDPGDAETKRELRSWLHGIQSNYQYESISLLDARGVARMSLPREAPVDSIILQQASQALQSGQVAFQDFYRDSHDRRIYLAILVPVCGKKDSDRPLGVVVLRIDPGQFLYPLIGRWPATSRTADTLLIRREGNEAVVLNDRRVEKNTALNLRIPLERKELPVVQAALGREGALVSRDSQGIPVIAYIRAIPDTPWILVTRMDLSEVHAPLRERLWIIVALVVALLSGAAASVGFIWRGQQARFYRERSEAAEELLASKEKLQLALHGAEMGMWELDVPTMSGTLDERAAQILGYHRDDVPTHSYEWDRMTHPDDVPGIYEKLTAHLQGRIPVLETEHRMRRASGEWIWVHGRGNISKRDADDLPIRISGTILDITERKRAEAAVIRQHAVINAINKVFREVLTGKTVKDVAEKCLDVALELTGSRFGFIGEINKRGLFDTLALSNPGWNSCKIEPSIAAAMIENMEISGIWGKVLKDGQSLIVNDPASHPDRVGVPEGHPPVSSFLGIPLKKTGATFGMIALANKESGYDIADQQDIEHLSLAFGEALSRKRIEIALRESEDKYRALASSADSMYLVDRDCRYLFMNEGYRLRFGMPLDEIIGRRYHDFHSHENSERFAARVSEVCKTGKTIQHEHRSERDGRYFFRTFSPLREPGSEGTITGVAVVSKDITQIKEAEEKLKASHEQLRALAARQQQVREEERIAIAREIHDELGGALTGLKIDFSSLLNRLPEAGSGEDRTALRDRIHNSDGLVDHMIWVVRRIARELRPPVLDDLGLIAALEWQLEEFTSHTHIQHEFVTTLDEVDLEPATSIAVFRVFQEVLTNVARHSAATKLTAFLRPEDDKILLEVRDNGRGIRENDILDEKSYGILGMKERALVFGGEVLISGEPGGGTTVTLKIPTGASRRTRD